MKNSDMPSMPTSPNDSDPEWAAARAGGLTKRERFCLEMRIPETGDAELDEIIHKGSKREVAMMVLQDLIAGTDISLNNIAGVAVDVTDLLLAKLEK